MQQYPDLNKVKLKNRIEGLQNLKYDDILQKSFVSLVVGKPGSGKTSLIEQFLLNPDLYYKKFDFVFIISPSKFHNLQLDPQNCNNQFDLSWICQKLVDIKNQKIDKKFNVLFIFDDIISQINANQSQRVMQDLFFNRRNLISNCTISLLLTAQKFNTCPTVIRSVITSLFVFDVSPHEWELIRKEQMKLDARELKELLQNTIQSASHTHSFLYIKTSPFKIYHNFKPVIMKSDFKQLQTQLYGDDDIGLQKPFDQISISDTISEKEEISNDIKSDQNTILNYNNQLQEKLKKKKDQKQYTKLMQQNALLKQRIQQLTTKQKDESSDDDRPVITKKPILEQKESSFEQFLKADTKQIQRKTGLNQVQNNQQSKTLMDYF